MRTTPKYEALWVPGLDNDDVDPDEALTLAFDRLRRAERKHSGTGVLVMNTVLMRRNRPLLESAPWEIVSRRSRGRRDHVPVLAIWPEERTLAGSWSWPL